MSRIEYHSPSVEEPAPPKWPEAITHRAPTEKLAEIIRNVDGNHDNALPPAGRAGGEVMITTKLNNPPPLCHRTVNRSCT